ncbi:DUF3037 domain-containing protein [Chitinophaga silvisoli]|uniref:DUF3037 domain-containing protein n=1 Tax=Chitinophaga silvisoli TaxID=2291814 RepID=A0A3E1NSL2_9BACT|nr:DUF3037 domain-containing protein [Chitinophaga silvisoli]RFM30834.1 DUF3037 domain-containing protein [Chitinophaga silvisoli]
MTNSFTYSVLQYHHSLMLGESINVGILFWFPSNEEIHFISGNINRIKSLYSDFDQSLYNYLSKNITNKIRLDKNPIFTLSSFDDFKKFIKTSILPEDATVLQFQDPVNVVLGEIDIDIEKTIEEFSNLLLPNLANIKSGPIRHNEHFLIKKFTDILIEHPYYKNIEKKLLKNKVITTNVNNTDIQIRIDLAWQNGSTNIIKPLSFDLSEEKNIIDKSLLNYGYLNLLGDYAKQHNYRFDFIVSKPQERSLFRAYENAIGLIENSDAPKRIIQEEDIAIYSNETLNYLLSNN